MTPLLSIKVGGKAEPQGSKKGFVVWAWNDKHTAKHATAQVVDVRKTELLAWRGLVAGVAKRHYNGDVLDGAIGVSGTFWISRPKSHYRSGRNSHLLKDSSPWHPIYTPDLDKLIRAVGDALSGIVYTDDSRITDFVNVRKRYGHTNELELEFFLVPDPRSDEQQRQQELW